MQRYLIHRGLQVDSYMNFTDLDDNTIAGAMAAQTDLRTFTRAFIDQFTEAATAWACARLLVLRWPRSTWTT